MLYMNIFILFTIIRLTSSVGIDYDSEITEEILNLPANKDRDENSDIKFSENIDFTIGYKPFGRRDPESVNERTNNDARKINDENKYNNKKDTQNARKDNSNDIPKIITEKNVNEKEFPKDFKDYVRLEDIVKDYLEYSDEKSTIKPKSVGKSPKGKEKAALRTIETIIDLENESIQKINVLPTKNNESQIINDKENTTSKKEEQSNLSEFNTSQVPAEENGLRGETGTDDDKIYTERTVTPGRTAATSRTLYREMYNLAPAVDYLQPYDYPRKARNIWYVPEAYPCWELPLIYGEIAKQNESEVFATYPLYLRHVKDNNSDPMQRDKQKTNGHILLQTSRESKWCASTPCHGDHTMCLFPKDEYAPMCNPEYRVLAPTVKEQIALQNTINAMRNYVAKGTHNSYPFLPPAANMKQMMYSIDLEDMAVRWLKQCLPGPAPCISMDLKLVTQLECVKRLEGCCWGSGMYSSCTPQPECYVDPVVGCLHAWFSSAGSRLEKNHIKCGHIEPNTFHTAQLLWATTNKIGCAYARKRSGQVRVICNFAPGAPFSLDANFYCGIFRLKDMRKYLPDGNVTDPQFLQNMGFHLDPVSMKARHNHNDTAKSYKFPDIQLNKGDEWGVLALRQKYSQSWMRKRLYLFDNGSIGAVARLVTRYRFHEQNKARCDTTEAIYKIGEPGSRCKETGGRFTALCYDFRAPSTFRVIAVMAPMLLFSLILYDLFSSVPRQGH